MKITYSPVESQIFDYLYTLLIPYLTPDKIAWDMTPSEKIILQDALEVMEELQAKLSHLVEQIDACGEFSHMGHSFGHLAYFYFVNQGEHPASWNDFLSKLAQLSEEEALFIWGLLVKEILDEAIDTKPATLCLAIEQSDLKAEEKWHLTQAIRYPLKKTMELVTLLQEVALIYTPYYVRFEAERQSFVESIQVEEVLANLPQIVDEAYESIQQSELTLVVLSPWQTRLAMADLEAFENLPLVLYISSRMDQIVVEKEQFEFGDIIAGLKVIADETRYQVLVELTKPHAKNKDIAEKLGITTAAVSFHTQKLINSQFIIFNGDNKEQKYKVNQAFLTQLLARLQEDFEE